MTRPRVLGHVVDAQTRCTHYNTVVDVIAIRFFCCGEYYPCHLCHAEVPGQHEAKRWPVAEYDARAVMCGVCGHQLSIAGYLARADCPGCGAWFNPGCQLHADLYFAPATPVSDASSCLP